MHSKYPPSTKEPQRNPGLSDSWNVASIGGLHIKRLLRKSSCRSLKEKTSHPVLLFESAFRMDN